MPDGPIKDEPGEKITQVKYKKSLLQNKKVNYGVLALVEREYGIATIDRSNLETDDLIEQLTDRMNSI